MLPWPHAHPGEPGTCLLCYRERAEQAEEQVADVMEISSSSEVDVIPLSSDEEEVMSEEVKICCMCHSNGHEILTCTKCNKIHIHKSCVKLENSLEFSESSWNCQNCMVSVQQLPIESMSLSVRKTSSGQEYKVKDLPTIEVEVGRVDISFSKIEMPGLMACREEFGQSKPLAGARISCSLQMTSKSAVLIETLTALGAEMRCCSCNISSTEDHVAAAIIASDSAAVFAWKGETLQEYWLCMERCMDWGPQGGPDLIVDDGGDATLLVHEGVHAEEEYEKTGKLPNPDGTDNAKCKIMLSIVRDRLKVDPKKYRKMNERIVGVSEQTTTGVRLLYQMQESNRLLFPAINVNDSVTKSKFYYESDHCYLPNRLKDAADNRIANKVAVVCGYGEIGKACAAALKKAEALVSITEIDPICALQAVMEGIDVLTLEDVVSKADIFVTATGNKDVIKVEHMTKMKNNAIICNIGHCDNEIDIHGLETYPGVNKITIKKQNSQIDRFVFPVTNNGIFVLAENQDRLINPGFSLTNQLVA